MQMVRLFLISSACLVLLNIDAVHHSLAADPPPVLPGELPKFQPPPRPPASQQLDVLQRALDGDPNAASGDPMFDDLLEMIRRGGGSVLNGSALETIPDSITDGHSEFHADSHGMTEDAGNDADQRAHAAEALLRAARLLKKVPENDPQAIKSRDILVNDMRRQAVRLLSQTLDTPPR
ncbi:hypothetical protein [Stieleria varia]|uniref:Secreted protein n=1 Tax=Stieleria varia TaxID=2528005 RepID=A0A5C6B7K0_9BACT|nr:hypothetical protein [Stieleria varia]TWU07920.1 hypothetical protein Pla52n_04970 [Stieleria varia]